jgi:cytochrome c oxidase assembly factor CtaG
VSPDASWTLAPGVLLTAGAGATVYVQRWRRARSQGGPRAASGWRLAAVAAGLLLVLVALVSPVDRLGEQLMVMHMVQHVVLLDLVPILVILGLTRVILRPVSRRAARIEHAAGPLAHPVFAVALYVVTMCAWHVPAAYDAALESPVLHVVEHLTMALAGGLYWWHLLSPIRARLRLGGMGPIVYMLSTKLLVGLLGIVLAFAPDALYDFYEEQPGFWGLSAEEDQAVAGLVMALEQSIVMGIALAFLFARMLAESDREDERAERYGEP